MLVSCSQVNDMMIKINKLFHKLAVAHYGTYNAILVIGHSCCFFHFLGNRASSMLFVIWNMNSRDWLWLSVLCTTDGCVCMCERSFAHHYILWGFEPSNLLGCASSLFCREKQTENVCADGDFFKETELCFCSVMSSSGELLTSCLGPMKHHFEYREPFQDDLLHQNNQHKQRNVLWLPLFSGPMCAPIPHVPLLNTQGNKYVV